LVKDVLFISENDLLVVEKGDRQILIPFTESICIEVDLEKKEIVIDPPDGLLNLNEI
jgi:16S rRNA processing protein RimM